MDLEFNERNNCEIVDINSNSKSITIKNYPIKYKIKNYIFKTKNKIIKNIEKNLEKGKNNVYRMFDFINNISDSDDDDDYLFDEKNYNTEDEVVKYQNYIHKLDSPDYSKEKIKNILFENDEEDNIESKNNSNSLDKNYNLRHPGIVEYYDRSKKIHKGIIDIDGKKILSKNIMYDSVKDWLENGLKQNISEKI